jgi:hypothetical protein
MAAVFSREAGEAHRFPALTGWETVAHSFVRANELAITWAAGTQR